MIIKDTYIEVDNCKHAVRFINTDTTKTTPTIVFLHDALGSIAQWKKFPELIIKRTNFNAVLIERQGYGSSSPSIKNRTKNYLHHEAWVVLPKVLKELKIEVPNLIGHSDGASIALLYGAKYPTQSIVSIAAHIFVEEKTITGIKNTLRFANLIKPKLLKYHGDKAEKLFDEWQKVWLSEDFLNWNIEWDISTLDSPLTLKQVDGIEEMVKTKQVKKMILDKSGHAPHLNTNDTDNIVKSIVEFIK